MTHAEHRLQTVQTNHDAALAYYSTLDPFSAEGEAVEGLIQISCDTISNLEHEIDCAAFDAAE